MNKVLIANRGEIARRIIRTARAMGLKTVAVYSEADQDLPFVEEADEAIALGGKRPLESYLKQDKILDVARRTGADAVHPGYGFLSENAAFAQAVRQAGLTFIGPEPKLVAMMGDKAVARSVAEAHGVPVVPGTEGLPDVSAARIEARALGYPVMLKAKAGGGGIGMQRIDDEAMLEKSFAQAENRARAAFGDGTLYLEKALVRARHVEVQIAADRGGEVVHLFERDCSLQRRHQKVVEESPAPELPLRLREKIWEAAVRLARGVSYTNVGTIEFLVEPEKETFYFLEMNTRLQVEHGITELVTGEDLVAWQFLISMGEPLPKKQFELYAKGAAAEFRIYAEDPVTFYPSPGTLQTYEVPRGEGVRVDDGYRAGNVVSPFYDPLLGKLMVHAPDRAALLTRAREALSAYRIEGVKTNIPLLLKVLDDPRFIEGAVHTEFFTQPM
ncbi:MAG: ATP-grasp domain-containing protein [Candidatus Carbobacillus altaicus]|nr:ATP-grasp domain-containing protein [Candidatus Carbobacillus altaicus]